MIKIAENKELKVALYTNEEGFEKILEYFDIEVGHFFSPGYIYVAGGLKNPGFYNIQIGLCTIENIYLERVKMEVN